MAQAISAPSPTTFQMGTRTEHHFRVVIRPATLPSAIPTKAQSTSPNDPATPGILTDVNVNVRLNHHDGDLVMSLIAPDNTTVALVTNRGGSVKLGSGTNDCSGTPTTFDDSAATAISASVAPSPAARPESPALGLQWQEHHQHMEAARG
jgi:hypothetical protein